MGVTIRKKGGKWYVFVNYHGRRKAKCVGTSRQLAEEIRRQLEARLALGDLGFLAERPKLTFADYNSSHKCDFGGDANFLSGTPAASC